MTWARRYSGWESLGPKVGGSLRRTRIGNGEGKEGGGGEIGGNSGRFPSVFAIARQG